MSEQEPKLQQALEGLDAHKRETLTRLIRGSAFVAPVVASFAMQGISIQPAHAQPGSSSNMTGPGPIGPPPSDRRLKRDIDRIGTHPGGFGIYRFRYLWSETRYIGVIAQEVQEKMPEAVCTGPGGFLGVNYDALGMAMIPETVH
ncbi:MAG: tail fiber domain-containing protein [Xanthobacteraceae bacterium]|nr:tail fiber domain-containing protein [Xanthobacteraceae bacterium]